VESLLVFCYATAFQRVTSHKDYPMRIVVDAMGSDACPVPDVEGAVLAAQEFGDTILLVGDQAKIESELQKHNISGLKLEVIHAEDVIEMTDKPSVVGKGKPQSSMHVGMKLVGEGKADAFVTAGNTGAALTIATLFTLRRITGVKRPALASIIRVEGALPIIVLDIGANADSKSEWLVQFAVMGQIYAQKTLEISNPRIALLSNGEEEGKGNQLIHETSDLLKQSSLNFVGNIEPKDMIRGEADVIVADGFVGNIAIKTLEAMGSALSNLIRREIRADPISTLGGLLARNAFRRVARRVDPFEIGGAPLLGVNGVVIIGHGRSNAKAIKNAIRQARLAIDGQVIQAIRDGLKRG
jgi:phosphate acyltransferase